MSEMIRSFIAFDIDNELVLRRFAEVQGMLLDTGANLNLVKPENIHITLRFLGDVSLSIIDLIHEEMKKISFAPFNIEIRGLGAFPTMKYVRVVWAGIQRGAEELKNVFNQLEPRLRGLGFRPDPKGFSPHLTIARVRTAQRKEELVRRIMELADYNFGTVRADCLRLKRSVLTPMGPIYSTIHGVYAKT